MTQHLLHSLRARIILTVILLISTPFAILQLSNSLLVYSKLKEKTVYTTEALSVSIATNVNEFVNGAYRNSLLMSQNNDVV